MIIELSTSALTTDGTTDPINDPALGIVEYRFRFPTKIDEIRIDISDATEFAEIQSAVDAPGHCTIQVFYRHSNTPEETSGTLCNHGKGPIFDDTISSDIVSDGNDATLYSSFTSIERLLREAGWKATLKLKNPLWCSSFGVRIKLA